MIDYPKIKWWFKSHFETKPVIFVGWIASKEEDRQLLKDLGVQGAMIWTSSKQSRSDKRIDPPTGIYEHCTITMEVAKRLKETYPYFSPFVFTGIDENGNQTHYQPLWRGIYD